VQINIYIITVIWKMHRHENLTLFTYDSVYRIFLCKMYSIVKAL